MKKNRYLPFYIFFVFFTVLVLSTKILGYTGRANLYSSEPLSWNEIYNNLPIYIIASIVFTFGFLKILKYASEQQKRDVENAKKSIEESERKEKEENQD